VWWTFIVSASMCGSSASYAYGSSGRVYFPIACAPFDRAGSDRILAAE
jgi:hypothetical protein